MRPSGYRSRHPRRGQYGFTLMEVLVVLVIVAIVAGFAILSTASIGGSTQQEKTARHIASLLELASQDAVMESKQLGLRVQPHSYRFFVYGGKKWQPITDNPTFRKHQLNTDITLRLELEGRKISMPQPVTAISPSGTPLADGASNEAEPDTNNTDTATETKPQILALSSGQLTQFTLEIASTGGNASYHVRGHMNGKIQIVPPDSKVLDR